jgi:hypothetical protein
VVEFRYKGIKHAAFVRPVPEAEVIRIKDPVQGLLLLWKDGAEEYFGSERWVCFLFERGIATD